MSKFADRFEHFSALNFRQISAFRTTDTYHSNWHSEWQRDGGTMQQLTRNFCEFGLADCENRSGYSAIPNNRHYFARKRVEIWWKLTDEGRTFGRKRQNRQNKFGGKRQSVANNRRETTKGQKEKLKEFLLSQIFSYLYRKI